MQAWLVSGAGAPSAVLERVERAAPEVGPGLVRARVHAAGCGLPDVLMCRGTYPLTPPLPFTPGQEIAGEVLEVGPDCESRVGERIMGVTAFLTGFGGFADEALVYDHFALPIPAEMSDEQAAGFSIPYHTAWVGLVRRAALAPKETLLVLGASGGTGSAAVQLGRALGARVIAAAGGPDKVAFCRALGADEVIDYRSEDIPERVRELTGGTGAQVIYDPVGGVDGSRPSHRSGSSGQASSRRSSVRIQRLPPELTSIPREKRERSARLTSRAATCWRPSAEGKAIEAVMPWICWVTKT